MDKGELLRKITTAHSELAELVNRISDERLAAPAMGDWTGKDVLAHLAWWQDHSARLIEDFNAQRQPDDTADHGGTTDEINEAVYRDHINDSPGVSLAAFRQSFRRLLAALEPLTTEDLFSSNRCPWMDGEPLSEMLLWDTSRHYHHHLEDLASLSQSHRM